MKAKRMVLVWLAAMCCLLAVGPVSLAAEMRQALVDGTPMGVTVQVDGKTGMVTATGNTGVEKERNISVMVLEEGIAAADLTEENFAEQVAFVGQVKTQPDGTFSITFRAGEDGWIPLVQYWLYTGGALTGSEGFQYVPDALEATVLAAVHAATAEQWQQMLLEGAPLVEGRPLNDYLQLDLTVYTTLTEKNVVDAAMVSGTYVSFAALREDFAKRVTAQKEWEDKQALLTAALAEFADVTPDTLDALITKHSYLLEIDVQDEYGYALLRTRHEAGRDDGFSYLIAQINVITDPTLAIAAVDEAILMGVIRTADLTQLEDVLKHYAERLQLDFTDYNALGTAEKSAVLSAFRAISVTEPEDVAPAFQSALSSVEEGTGGGSGRPSGGNTGGGGSSGSGGSGSGGGFHYTQSPQTNPDEEEPSAQAPLFTDLDDDHWAYSMVAFLTERQVINGYEDGAFGPDNSILREEFIKIVVTGFGLLDTEADSAFADVAPGDWSYPYVSSAQAAGIVQGSDGAFGAGERITRQDAAVILARVLTMLEGEQAAEGELAFVDADQIADYAQDGVRVLSQRGIISGYPDGSFQPAGEISRSEAAAMIFHMMNEGGSAA